MTRTLVGVAQRGFEALWGLAFGVLGRVRGPRALPLQPGGSGGVLVVAPHPDDEVAGCGGTIARHVAAGDAVTLVYVTDGRGSRALGLAPDKMAEVRRREADAAAAALGVERVVWLGLREGEQRHADVRRLLAGLLERTEPAVVYAPSRVDFHPVHRAVAHALAQALASLRRDGHPTVRVFQVQVPLGSALVNRVCRLAEIATVHDRALELHASQLGAIRRCRRMKRYAARRHGSGSLTEEFWEMAGVEYVRLHQSSPDGWNERFRALRYLALSDPAAYLVGCRARRRLLRRRDR